MSATRPRGTAPDRLELTPREFHRRLAARGRPDAEIRRLWDELAELEPEPRAAGPAPGVGPVIALGLGLLLVVAAAVSLLVLSWDDLGAAGVLAVGLVYVAGSLGASGTLRRRDAAAAAGVLAAVAVGWVGLVAYALQELAGVWPAGTGDAEIHRGLTTIAVVGIGAAVLLLGRTRDAPLLVPLAAGTGLLAVDLAEVVFGGRLDELSGRQAAAFVLPLGLAWVAVGLGLDATRRRALATWAHWCGLLLAGAALIVLVPKTVPGFAIVGVAGAVALFFSAFVRHWSFTVVGAFGVLNATTASIGEVGRLAPLVIAVVGLALIVVGLRWSRWREAIRSAVLARMPTAVRHAVARLAP